MVYRECPKWGDYRKWNNVRDIAYDCILKAVRNNARQADEWTQDYLYTALRNRRLRGAQWPFSDEIRAYAVRTSISYGRRRLRLLTEYRQHVALNTELESPDENAISHESPAREIWPDDEVIANDILRMILLCLVTNKPIACRVFYEHHLRGKQFTEIADETGIPADNLRHLNARIIQRLRAHAAGKGVTESEIHELLNMIDRHSGGLQ